MPAIQATAPGKIILCGEHAVVYNRPAIAVPVNQVQAHAAVFAEIRAAPGYVHIDAPDISLSSDLRELPADHPLARLFALLAAELGLARYPALSLKVTSSIPLAAGMGSGAAISVAVLRALSGFLGQRLPVERVSALAYELEKIFHGTPSGIDNTVIAYAQPIFFQRGQPFELLRVAAPFTLVIADTGIRSPTVQAVGGVRARWQLEPQVYEALFDQVAEIAHQARAAIQTGTVPVLGPLLDANHTLLQQIGVSCPELDRLVDAARAAGAWGAKLSGGGQGGNMLALVDPAQAPVIMAALQAAGAVRVIATQVDITRS